MLLSPKAASQSLAVYGWPAPESRFLDSRSRLGDDPIVGRLACPPLTRLNLRSQKVDHLLLRRVHVLGLEWQFELRSGLTWWSGEPVTGADLAAFLESHVEAVAAYRGAGLWKVPPYTVNTAPSGQVIVRWRDAPSFGPYVLNGVPFARVMGLDSGTQYECVGLHRLRLDNNLITLEPRGSQRSRLASVNLFPALEKDETSKSGAGLIFKTAPDFSGNPWTRPGDDHAACAQMVDLPILTMIAWRTESGPTADAKFRRLLTQMVPRGPILRSGAAGLGELLTAPIARRHPGYDASLALRPSDLEAASQGLDRLGYRRSSSTGLRKLPDSKNDLKLTIATSLTSSSMLVQKVLVDAFQAVGISVRFVPQSELKSDELYDGLLATFKMDWPDGDLLGDFHSRSDRSKQNGLLMGAHGDLALDEALERYSKSLTFGELKPNLVTAIHRRLYELELVTVVMQHKACLESNGAISFSKGGPDMLDPDWFRAVIFPANAE